MGTQELVRIFLQDVSKEVLIFLIFYVVGLVSKTKPLSVKFGFEKGGEEHNSEGRLITAEFDSFYLVTTYVPNAGRGEN